MQICCCKFEAMEGGFKRYKFKLADCAAIVDELDAVDWCSLFSGREVTNAWTYSTRRSGAALKDMCLRDILTVNKNCHG
jgi:hypothetical protein